MTTAIANHRPAGLSVNGKDRLKAISKASTADLKKELADALSLTAEHLNYLGAVWGELERRGENLSELRQGMGFYLAKIAAGELLAEMVVKYAGEPGTLRRMGTVPLDTQRVALTTGELPWADVAKKRGYNRVTGSNRNRDDGEENGPPVANGVPDLKTTLDEAIYGMKKFQRTYGHLTELQAVFKAFDELKMSRGQ